MNAFLGFGQALGYYKEIILLARQGGRSIHLNGNALDSTKWRGKMSSQLKDPRHGFDEVLEKELKEIKSSREERGARRTPPSREGANALRKAHDAQLVGLAFSGGGIRSATFCLGVLQALAHLRLLSIFDYLSTVSGGGYIGSWLAAFVQRKGLKTVQEALDPDSDAPEPSHVHSDGKHEPKQLQYLRKYSNYLTPRLGFLGSDTWTLGAAYFRNLLLNLLILVLALSAVLQLPYLFTWILACGKSLISWAGDFSYHILLLPSILFLIIGLSFCGLNLRDLNIERSTEKEKKSSGGAWYTERKWINLLIVFPIFLAAWLGSDWLWHYANNGAKGAELALTLIIGTALLHTFVWFIGWGAGFFFPRADEAGKGRNGGREFWAPIMLAAPLAGAAGGVVIWLIALLFSSPSPVSTPIKDQGFWNMLIWGTPLLLLAFSTTITMHIGLMGRSFREYRREWWSRLAGSLFIVCAVWTVLYAFVFYGPWTVNSLFKASKTALSTISVGWILSTIYGIFAGKSPRTGSQKEPSKLDKLAKIAPYVFVAGLFALLSWAIFEIIALGYDLNSTEKTLEEYWRLTGGVLDQSLSGPVLLLSLLVASGISLYLSWRVDINEFSIHHLYQKRLVRCYLGASNDDRCAQPYTGFDSNDDLLLKDLFPGDEQDLPSGRRGPYPILNTALNITSAEEMSWQERKSASFIFSPLFCGYEHPAANRASNGGSSSHEGKPCEEEADLLPREGYRDTKECAAEPGNRGVRLGAAMAISGAAASPNMGYHSAPALAFLMTVFNVRLGWWLGNPRCEKPWSMQGPASGLFYLFNELLGYTTDRSQYVYLSDGGHFENLGIYELVRRRCRYIVACDASQDGDMTFEDLGNAIRKCRADFMIDIEIDVDPIRRHDSGNSSQWHCAIGTIHYERVDPESSPGMLVYLKSSLTGDEPTDVRNYAAVEPTFPHQTTADQWFSESQFESYRWLGFHVAYTTFQPVIARLMSKAGEGTDELEDLEEESLNQPVSRINNEELFVRLRQAWYPPSTAVKGSFTNHASMLTELLDEMSKNPKLGFLDAQFYPGWHQQLKELSLALPESPAGTQAQNAPGRDREWLPEDPEEMRHGFYFCQQLIQLMENVYLDLNLEREWRHPDNQGWINLFRHWSWSSMFQVTWTVTGSTYGLRFRDFCRQHLSLDIGEFSSVELSLKSVRESIELESLFLERTDSLAAFTNDPPKTLRSIIRGERDIEKDLNFLEMEQIVYFLVPFIREEKNTEGLVVHVLQLIVKDPTVNPREKSDREVLQYAMPFGFAIVQRGTLKYLRIQDHLRKRGLARMALKHLLEAGSIYETQKTPLLIHQSAREVVDTKHQAKFKQLFESVEYEVRSAVQANSENMPKSLPSRSLQR